VSDDRTGAPSQPRRGVLGGLAAAAALVLGKLKLVLLFLLKLGKLATTASTMLLAAWAYALMYGWRFAAGLVLLTLVHEVGHALAARRLGLPVSAPVFVPFFGAYVKLGKLPRSSWESFLVSIGGPLAGSAASALCALAGAWAGGFGGGLLVAVGFYGLTINLFNLVPFGFLDGARAIVPISWRAGAAATACAGFVLFVAVRETGHLDPVPLLVLIGAAWQFWSRSRRPATAPADPIPDVATIGQRQAALAIYFGTVMGLTVAVQVLHAHLPRVR
jgi:Zn-dependent protease